MSGTSSQPSLLRFLLDQVKSLDAEYEEYVSQGRSVLGLQVVPGIVLLLRHFALKIGRFTAEEHVTEYDHYILMFPELLSVRAVRFSGELRIDEKSSLLLEKLQRRRGRSRIELEGSFVTMGRLWNVNASVLQMLMPVLMALIRPFSKDQAIFPSPLSLIAHELQGRGPGKLYLSPCSLTVILEREKIKHKDKFWVLGYWSSGYLAYGRALSYRSSDARIDYVPLKVFLPISEKPGEVLDEKFKEYPRYDLLVAHLLGVFVFEEGSPMLRPEGQGRGYFLALQEVPFLPEAEALAIHGEPRCLRIRAPHLTRRDLEYCYAVECDERAVRAFKQAVGRRISQLGRGRDHAAIQETVFSSSKGRAGLLEQRNGLYRLLAPPLIALAAEKTDFKAGLDEASRILERLERIASSEGLEASLELSELRGDRLARRVLEGLGGPWRTSFEAQKNFARDHGMEYLI
ncbi:MAG: hypothetical protein LM590_15815 [Thermofilum sp.]|nr:hypothetical protein [Thermofilum sp.]